MDEAREKAGETVDVVAQALEHATWEQIVEELHKRSDAVLVAQMYRQTKFRWFASHPTTALGMMDRVSVAISAGQYREQVGEE